jgi:hypothetical protein
VAFNAESVITGDVAAALKVATADLPSWWATVITRCHTAAYQTIIGALVARGFTKAVADTWDRGAEFERTIALYFCFTSPQGQGHFDLQAVKEWDRREELATVQVFVSGAAVDPTTSVGVVGVGRVSTTVGVFNPFTADDDNEGPMRF